METLKGKRVLITGASGSIGSSAAHLIANSGATVYITGRNEERLQVTAAKCQLPANRVFVSDITNENSVKEIANAILQDGGPIDILINAAGIGIIKPIETLSTEDFQKSIAINLMAPFYLIQSFLPGMKENKKGLIINIPGILGKTPMAGATAYSASKYGLNGMMKSLREELKRTDIRITQLFLGGADTHFWDTIDLRVQRDKMIVADEAGRAIWFLCQQPLSGVVSEMVLQPFNHQAI